MFPTRKRLREEVARLRLRARLRARLRTRVRLPIILRSGTSTGLSREPSSGEVWPYY